MFDKFKLVLALFVCVSGLFAQSKVILKKAQVFEPIVLHKPVLLDSVHLKNEEFSDELMLSSSISIPKYERFATQLSADTAGFFHFE